jgi:protein phosphatase
LVFQCIGGSGEFEADTGNFKIQAGDLLLFSTDGLHDEVPEKEIVSALRSDKDLAEKTDDLLSAALAAGGKDNIAVVMVKV